MSDEIQLSDLFEFNYSQFTPHFQQLISGQLEYSELPSKLGEVLEKGKGKYFNHQIFTHRFLRNYNDLLVMSETGTGKSCEIIGFTEGIARLIKLFENLPEDADEKLGHFKRIIILVRSDALKTELKNQIICKCSDGSYEQDIINKKYEETTEFVIGKKKKSDETKLRGRKTTILKKAGYEFYTYGTFANMILDTSKYPDTEEGIQRLMNEYADTVFWVDEAHNLIIDEMVDTVDNRNTKERVHTALWRLFHTAPRCKRILTTATPMLNSPRDIINLMNLILPVNGILPTGFNYLDAPEKDIETFFPNLPYNREDLDPEEIAKYFVGQIPADYDIEHATLDDLEPYFRGKITYVRSSNPNAIPVEQGTLVEERIEVDGEEMDISMTLELSTMSEFQSEAYNKAISPMGGVSSIYTNERQCANFVYPDGFWGSGMSNEEYNERTEKISTRRNNTVAPENGIIYMEDELGNINFDISDEQDDYDGSERGFKYYVKDDGHKFTFKNGFEKYINSIDRIKWLSSKFGRIVELIIENPKEKAYVYCKYLRGSGLITLGLCLEAMGYERYDGSQSIFASQFGKNQKPVCSNNQDEPRRIKSTFKKKRRYALFYAGKNNDNILEAYNCYENRYGEYIQAILISPVGREGINLKDTTQIHLVGAEWNFNAIYQELSRAIRVDAHDDLIEDKRQQLLKRGKNPDDAKIYIKIYKHVSLNLADTDEPAPLSLVATSIDLQMYNTAENKERKIKRILRIMKQCSISCQIHYERNVRDDDIDYSATCEYDICKYKCVDPLPDSIDTTNYDILYSHKLQQEIMEQIIYLYHYNNSLSLEQIKIQLQNYKEKYILLALEKLISQKITIYNRYGYGCYMKEDNGVFYIDYTYPQLLNYSNYSLLYYTDNLIITEHNKLRSIYEKIESGNVDNVIQELENMDTDSDEFFNALENLSVDNKAQLVEYVIFKYITDEEETNFIKTVMSKFKSFIFMFNDPHTELSKLYEELNNPKTKRGPKTNLEKRLNQKTTTRNKDFNVVVDTDTEVVYLHTIYSLEKGQTEYAIMSKINKGEGRNRILKPSEIFDATQKGISPINPEMFWHDVNADVYKVYNKFIQIENFNRVKELINKGNGLYGSLTYSVFRIHDFRNNTLNINDFRDISRGKECTNFSVQSMYDLLWHIQLQPPEDVEPTLTINNINQKQLEQLKTTIKQKIRKIDLDNWDKDKILFYYRWIKANYTRNVICSLIRERFDELGIMQYN